MSFDAGSCCRTEKLDNANAVEFRRGKSDHFTTPKILGSCSKVANNLEHKDSQLSRMFWTLVALGQ